MSTAFNEHNVIFKSNDTYATFIIYPTLSAPKLLYNISPPQHYYLLLFAAGH